VHASRRSWFLASVLLSLDAAIWISAGALTLAQGDHEGFVLGFYAGVLVAAPCFVIGALLIAHLPRHAVGWLLWLSAFFLVTNMFASVWGIYAAGTLPLAAYARIAGDVLWLTTFGIVVTLLPLVFPTGRFLTRRWRWVGCVAVFGMLLNALASAGADWHARLDPVTAAPSFDRPLLWTIVSLVGAALVIVATFATVASVVLRFRRAVGVERQQLKWFVFAAAINLLLIVYFLLPVFHALPFSTFIVNFFIFPWFLAMPLAIGVAILRFHLYEIDRIINRALVYAALTALLLGAYVMLIIVLQTLIDPLASGSNLVVAGSTLTVAALFRPLRARVQRAVDRRFYRRRYDASRTLETFAERLRDEIDLETLALELRAIVVETMQPAHISLWVRAPGSATL
jgi:hypothetical protein